MLEIENVPHTEEGATISPEDRTHCAIVPEPTNFSVDYAALYEGKNHACIAISNSMGLSKLTHLFQLN